MSQASSLSDFRSVGCEATAAVHFSPSSCPIARLWGGKSGNNCPRWGGFSLSTPKVRQAASGVGLALARRFADVGANPTCGGSTSGSGTAFAVIARHTQPDATRWCKPDFPATPPRQQLLTTWLRKPFIIQGQPGQAFDEKDAAIEEIDEAADEHGRNDGADADILNTGKSTYLIKSAF